MINLTTLLKCTKYECGPSIEKHDDPPSLKSTLMPKDRHEEDGHNISDGENNIDHTSLGKKYCILRFGRDSVE